MLNGVWRPAAADADVAIPSSNHGEHQFLGARLICHVAARRSASFPSLLPRPGLTGRSKFIDFRR